MGLWTKGINRSRTGKPRLESGDIFRWMDEICGEIGRLWGETCKYEHQVTPVGQMFIIKFGKCCISFPVYPDTPKIHLLAIVRKGIDDMMEKCTDRYTHFRLGLIHFNNIEV